jgi:2-polyprenyl-3-methyl-5-hydroxy-6-metoxy-1,4-benzoquinol methylase
MEISKQHLFLTVKDYSVSGENFQLFRDETLDLLITVPQPDENSLPKYYESEDYISHTDAKRSLFEKAYHFVKGKALKDKLKLINTLQKSKGNLLDIGAGTGEFLMIAKANGWSTIGIEPNDKAKGIAIKKGVEFSENTQILQSHSYDVITMWHVLEHVPNLENQIRELKRLLKTDGTLLIAVPNFNSYDAKHYGVFWAAYDVPRHLWHFSKTAIKKLFGREGMSLEQVLPMPFDAFYVSLLSEKYKTGKMNFLKAFFIGWQSNRRAKHNLEYSSHIYVLKNAKTP